jgi:purine nucleosidase
LIGQLVMMGGAVNGPGNVSAAAEFNVFCDPEAARAVFRLPVTKTLVPLDVTSQVVLRFDLLDQLPPEGTKPGRFLRKVLPFLYRSYRQELGLEGIYLHDAVTMAAVADPELIETQALGGDVELEGELTIGATVFDRRPIPQWRPNVHVATRINVAAARDRIVQGLALAGRQG